MKRIAINGFGRIGRLVFREMFDNGEFEVVAINDLTSPKMLAHLLKYDSVQKKYDHKIESDESSIIVDNKKITIYKEQDASKLPWKSLDIDVVMECTGFYNSKEKSMAHINAGAKKVIISAPAGEDLKTIVYSVNEKILSKDDKIVSAASCTTNCLAPMANALNNYAKIKSGIMTTVHAYTGAQRVPVPTGSTTILVAVVEGKNITKESINEYMKSVSNDSYGYIDEPIVSSDIIGISYGSLFDATQTMVNKIDEDTYQVQVVAWYDNEYGYTCQMVRTASYLMEISE